MKLPRFPIPFNVFRQAAKELSANDPLRMAGAMSFFTTFALPAVIIIIIQALGLVFNEQRISNQLFEKLEGVIGERSVTQVSETLSGFTEIADNIYITIIGSLFLFFVATTLFKVIKSSINQIWKIKVDRRRNVWRRLQNRLLSFLVILITGILFLAGILAETAQAFLGDLIAGMFPEVAAVLQNTLSIVVSLLIVTIWFAVLFRYLPDGRPDWNIALVGALITGVLFNSGKVLLRVLLLQGNISTIYGAGGSLVLLLLFVFYSSLILFYGAAFTKIWAEYKETPIQPLPHAISYRQQHIDTNTKEIIRDEDIES